MKLVGVLSTAVLSLALGTAAPVYGQQEQHETQEERKDKAAPQPEKHSQQEERKAQQDKPARQEENPQQQDRNAKQEENTKQEEKSAQQQDRNNKPEEKNAQQQHSQPTQGDGGRIPEDRYRANFGREHRFRVTQGDYSNRRFQYGGYWFGFVDPWPTNWLYTQEVFVVYIDGVYYLCNPMYPGVNIALSLAM